MAWSDAARAAAALARRRRPISKKMGRAAFARHWEGRTPGGRAVISVHGDSVTRLEMAAALREARRRVTLAGAGGNPYARTNAALREAVRKFRPMHAAPGEMFFGRTPRIYHPTGGG